MGGERRLAPEYQELLKQHKRELKRRRIKVEPEKPVESTPPPPCFSESEEEWDEVELDQSSEDDEDQSNNADEELGDITVSLSPSQQRSVKRAPLYSRQQRLDMHLICLGAQVLHTRIRNSWTLTKAAADCLRNILPLIVQQELHPPAHLSYNLKTKKLMDGIRAAMNIWSKKFTITSIGLYCVDWEEIEDTERVITRATTQENFFYQLQNLSGSLDVFTQGFCALLRANNVECRLICSLQPPDFTTPGKSTRNRHPIEMLDKPPIYWTEVWDSFSNQWISADPCQGIVQLVRGKNLFEPKVGNSRNIMRYCLAWDSNCKVRDVTRRYASQYNARTRKKRLSHAGKKYALVCDAMISRFSVKTLQKRDLEELKQLKRRELTEGIPARVQDFVGHPVYVLEHQLKKTEYIDPKTPCGRLAVKEGTIPIFLRKNVKSCLSARSWYRKGRVIRPGEQPKLRRKGKNLVGEEEEVGLYNKEQTTLFEPEPVIDGQVPKSEYGTIDLFTPWMLPRNAAYVVDKMAERSAKLLEVDYARAVVGAEFERRSMRSVYKGIVIPAANVEAVKAVCEGLNEIEQEKLELKETVRLLSMWRRLIIGIRIWDRVETMNPETGRKQAPESFARPPTDQSHRHENHESPDEVAASAWDPGLSDSESENSPATLQPSQWHPGSDSDSDSDSGEVLKVEPTDAYTIEVPKTEETVKIEPPSQDDIPGPQSPKPGPMKKDPKRTFTIDLNEVMHRTTIKPMDLPSEPYDRNKELSVSSEALSDSDFPDVFLDDDEY